MLLEVEVHGRVRIPKDYLDKNGGFHQSSILTGVMEELKYIKSRESHGYYIAVTKLNSIGNGEHKEDAEDVIFPVSFCCRTFLPIKGEFMSGVVYKVHNLGVFLRCGPMNFIYLSSQKMPGFHYVESKSGVMYVREDQSKIQNDVVVRFVVFAVRWGRAFPSVKNGREFKILASLEGDGLGPVSLAGTDELDL